ncbi:SMP-30/gluconolactonase/LRE family protein [Acidianus manzaensis]|uniref:Gluconolaconase n=1 Tax=Acidianus manzaensis TaxID=282676 RepID=A0A1W6JYY3_9CREN|nr:SMP-30/gluconolactonase/LRE family protein [Acidianus manzaensis]ARM75445.1 gluconolaconase [Acidianus manzaensis]
MINVFSKYKAKLAEGPVYDLELNKLFWVDIDGKKIVIKDLENKEEKEITTSDLVSSLCVINNTEVIATIRHDFYIINIDSGNILSKIDGQENDLENNRFNDGKCDKLGRYWAGTMNMLKDKPSGNLYKLEGNKIEKMLSQLTVSNGLGWNPENNIMYLIDSPIRKVYSFDYDLNKGEIFNRKVLIDFKDEVGNPDGMTVDEEGYLWIAHWNGGKISRWSPNGKKVFEIKLPVTYVSSVTFGGKEMNELFITTAYKEDEPLSGKVFTYKTDTRGLPNNRFNRST